MNQLIQGAWLLFPIGSLSTPTLSSQLGSRTLTPQLAWTKNLKLTHKWPSFKPGESLLHHWLSIIILFSWTSHLSPHLSSPTKLTHLKSENKQVPSLICFTSVTRWFWSDPHLTPFTYLFTSFSSQKVSSEFRCRAMASSWPSGPRHFTHCNHHTSEDEHDWESRRYILIKPVMSL